MKKRLRSANVFVLVLAAILIMTSCGSSGSSSAINYSAKGEAAYDYPEEGEYGAAAAENFDMDNGTDDAVMNQKTSDTAEQKQEEGVEAADSAQKLVYTCWMTIQTLEFDKTQASVKDAVKKTGCIIESESVNDSNYSWYYDSYKKRGTLSSTLRIRVPSKKYEEFLGLLDGAGGKVTSKSQNVENITKRYNDQTIYIQSLETQETRLLEMMAKAESVEDMITVETRLTEVQTQLNQARSTLASMDTDVKYSTVNLTLEEVVRYTDTPKTPVSFGERIVEAVKESWANFGEFLQDLLIGIIYLFPAILLIAVIGAIIFFARKAWRKKHPKVKKEKKPVYDQRHFFRHPGNQPGMNRNQGYGGSADRPGNQVIRNDNLNAGNPGQNNMNPLPVNKGPAGTDTNAGNIEE